MSVINNGLLLASAAEAAVGYQISRSLRFNSSDSAYLSRTPSSAGNRKTWTWSGWVKRSALASRQGIFGSTVTGSPQNLVIEFDSSDRINIVDATVSGGNARTTTAVYRDPSSWYHLVVTYDTTQATANNRVRLYVNGLEVTVFTVLANPSQNSDGQVNAVYQHSIGAHEPASASFKFNGYLADIHFIDGQALTPSSFGETDATTGAWNPKAYTGSYGTNGFRLPLSDNSGITSTTLGKDSAGSNNWTPNNFSVASGSGNDSLVDSPSSPAGQTDSGAGGTVRGNYCTWNPLNTGATSLANGNLEVTTPSTGYGLTYSTIAVSSGKWYWEVFGSAMTGAAEIGISKAGATLTNAVGVYVGGYSYVSGSQFKGNNNSYTSYGASYTTNDIIGVALDLDAGTLVFYKNGVSQGTAFSSLSGEFFPAVSDSSNSGGSTLVANFGARAFSYTAPSGFKALCTANLPTPTIAKGSDYMDVKLYTGNGSTQTISGLNFSPDWVWIKGRSGATDHALYDIVRGVQKDLVSNNTAAETTQTTGLTAFNSGGFDLGSLAKLNTSSATYAAWCWDAGSSTVSNTQGSITSQVRANASAGFSVVTYTGTATTGSQTPTVGHGLNVAPKLVITKRRDGASDWVVQTDLIPQNYLLYLNLTAAQTSISGSGVPNIPLPTSSAFTAAYITGLGVSGHTHVAYCFAPVAGYSSFGSYVGTGVNPGPFIYLGFRPRWILHKSASAAGGNWIVFDTERDKYNVPTQYLYANAAQAEATYGTYDILSNGFVFRSAETQGNANGVTYIYAAFAESPFAYARAR